MHTVRCVPRVLVLAAALGCGCGSRSGVVDDVLVVGRDAGSKDAAVPEAGVVVDAEASDAGNEQLGCDGLPLPRPGAVSSVEMPPRMHGLVVGLQFWVGILVIGGETSPGEDAREVAFLDVSHGVSLELPVEGDDVPLPGGTGAAVAVSDFEPMSVVVIGGSAADGVPTAGVVELTVNSDPDLGSPREVSARRLDDFPGGPVQGHVAIYDRRQLRVIVHGGTGLPDQPSDTRTTWQLQIDDEPSWSALVAAEDSPPPGTRAIGFDPVRRRAVEITDDEDGDGLAVYALTLEGDEHWDRLGEIDFAPSTRGELVWDGVSCGFHLLSARHTRCSLEHWMLMVDDASATTVFRGEPVLDPAHFVASSVFVEGQGILVVAASEDCAQAGTPNLVAAEITIHE